MLAARSPPQQELTSDIEVEMDFAATPAHSVSPHRPVDREGELSDHEADNAPSEADQLLSEEQSYRETVRGICSYCPLTLQAVRPMVKSFSRLWNHPKSPHFVRVVHTTLEGNCLDTFF